MKTNMNFCPTDTNSIAKEMYKLLATAFVVLGLTALPNIAHSADNNLKQVRCHIYFDDSRPVRFRLALDFQQNPEKLILKESNEPYKNSSPGFIEDFIVVKDDERPLDIIGNVNYKYGNTKDLISIKIINNIIHIAVDEKYELRTSWFSYVPTTKVSYIDMNITRRIIKPEKPQVSEPVIPVSHESESAPKMLPAQLTVAKTVAVSSTTDTLYIEKVVHDTIIRIVHDTVFVDKIVYVNRNDNNKLTGIRCEHLVNWWNDPHYRIEFQFSETPLRLKIKDSDQTLSGVPPGYRMQYKIFPDDADCALFIEDIIVEYIQCDKNVMLIRKDGAYFLLARNEIELQPHEFAYDTGKRVSYIRIRY